MSPRAEPLFGFPEPGGAATARMQWVLSALDPAERRRRIADLLGPWVTWLVHTYRLRGQIPPCWYRHPDVVERLKNLMVAWINIYTDDIGDRPLAYIEFDDALDRELRRVTVPPNCLDGDHDDPPVTWTTDPHQDDWLATADWATAPAHHPIPDFTAQSAAGTTGGRRTETTMTNAAPRPREAGTMIMSRADAQHLVTAGEAEPMRDYAIHYDGTWWLGDQDTYVRVTDTQFNKQLDYKAIKLARADQAVADTRQDRPEPTGAPRPDTDAGVNDSGESGNRGGELDDAGGEPS